MENVILVGDDLYKKLEDLDQVSTDNVNWIIFYLDKHTGQKWIKEFPFAESQGGGAPQLRLIDHFPWE